MNQILNSEDLRCKFMKLMGQLQVKPELKIDMSYGGVEWFEAEDSIHEEDRWVKIHLEVPNHLIGKFIGLTMVTTDNDEGYCFYLTDNNGNREYDNYNELTNSPRCDRCGWMLEFNCDCFNKQE